MMRRLASLLTASAVLLAASAAPASAQMSVTGFGSMGQGVTTAAQASLLWDTATGAAHSDSHNSFAGGDRDATGSSAGEVGVRALLPQPSGKSCVEFSVTTVAPTPLTGLGLAGANYDASNYLGSNGDSVAAFTGDVTYPHGVFATNNSSAWTTSPTRDASVVGDIYAECVDVDTGKAFIGKAITGVMTFSGGQNISTEASAWVTFTPGTAVTYAIDQKAGNGNTITLAASATYASTYAAGGYNVLNH